MRIGFSFPTGAEVALSFTQGDRVVSGSVDAWEIAHISRNVDGGRPHRLRLPAVDPATSPVPIVPQDDGTSVIDLTNHTKAGQVVLDLSDGRKALINYSDSLSVLGWSPALHYYLPIGDDEKFVLEPGRRHRKFYVTSGSHGYTKAIISQETGVPEASITSAWIVASEYGRTPEKALEAGIGRDAFILACTGPDCSHWFLMERGYDYFTPAPRAVHARGESHLHPIMIGAWGTGSRPVVRTDWSVGNNRLSRFVVWRDIQIANSISAVNLSATILESIISVAPTGHSAFQYVDAKGGGSQLTVRRMDIYNSPKPAPENELHWEANLDRWQAMYVHNISGIVIEECTFDYIAWEESWDREGRLINGVTRHRWENGRYGQAPSPMSHNLYFSATASDVLLRRNWSSRAASHGFQIRAGATIIDNVVVNSGLGIGAFGGSAQGNMPLVVGNIVENMKGEVVKDRQGDVRSAYSVSSASRLTGNIVAHPVDLHDPDDLWKQSNPSWQQPNKYYGSNPRGDDSIVLGWPDNENLLKPPAELADITIGKFIQSKGLADGKLKSAYPVIQADSARPYLDELLTWYRTGFGLVVAKRTAPTNVVFSPDTEKADGFQWFIRLNWSTGDLPGTVAGDTADLRGNWVRFADETVSLPAILLGTGARFEVVSGRITATEITGSGTIDIWNCGQLFTSQADMTDKPVTIRGGRLFYQAPVMSDDLTISGRSEVLFGTDFTLPAGNMLELNGDLPFVGWDGTTDSTLTLKGTLSLKSTVQVNAPGIHYTPIEGKTVAWSDGSGIVEDVNRVADGQHYVTLRDFTAAPIVGDRIVPPSDMDEPRLVKGVSCKLPMIKKFRSGVYGDAPHALSATVNLSGPLEIDARGLDAGFYTFLEADVINGDFSSVNITGLTAEQTATVNKTATALTLMIS